MVNQPVPPVLLTGGRLQVVTALSVDPVDDLAHDTLVLVGEIHPPLLPRHGVPWQYLLTLGYPAFRSTNHRQSPPDLHTFSKFRNCWPDSIYGNSRSPIRRKAWK
jgi:hypothetical protein